MNQYIVAIYGLEKLPEGLQDSHAKRIIEKIINSMYEDYNYDDGIERMLGNFFCLNVDSKIVKCRYAVSTFEVYLDDPKMVIREISSELYKESLGGGVISHMEYEVLANGLKKPDLVYARNPMEAIPMMDRFLEKLAK